MHSCIWHDLHMSVVVRRIYSTSRSRYVLYQLRSVHQRHGRPTKTDNYKVDDFDQWCLLRRICGVQWTDHITNDDIRRSTLQSPLSSTVAERRLALFCHVAWMEHYCDTSRALRIKVQKSWSWPVWRVATEREIMIHVDFDGGERPSHPQFWNLHCNEEGGGYDKLEIACSCGYAPVVGARNKEEGQDHIQSQRHIVNLLEKRIVWSLNDLEGERWKCSGLHGLCNVVFRNKLGVRLFQKVTLNRLEMKVSVRFSNETQLKYLSAMQTLLA